MTTLKADAVVCGAGIAGIAAAHALVRDAGLHDVLLVEAATGGRAPATR